MPRPSHAISSRRLVQCLPSVETTGSSSRSWYRAGQAAHKRWDLSACCGGQPAPPQARGECCEGLKARLAATCQYVEHDIYARLVATTIEGCKKTVERCMSCSILNHLASDKSMPCSYLRISSHSNILFTSPATEQSQDDGLTLSSVPLNASTRAKLL